jgi:hypothetical protein
MRMRMRSRRSRVCLHACKFHSYGGCTNGLTTASTYTHLSSQHSCYAHAGEHCLILHPWVSFHDLLLPNAHYNHSMLVGSSARYSKDPCHIGSVEAGCYGTLLPRLYDHGGRASRWILARVGARIAVRLRLPLGLAYAQTFGSVYTQADHTARTTRSSLRAPLLMLPWRAHLGQPVRPVVYNTLDSFHSNDHLRVRHERQQALRTYRGAS